MEDLEVKENDFVVIFLYVVFLHIPHLLLRTATV